MSIFASANGMKDKSMSVPLIAVDGDDDTDVDGLDEIEDDTDNEADGDVLID
jgi:hypothetical protein